MPILPSEVGGSGPRDEEAYAGFADRVRLRQLCEVLLTSRAKMLGLSQSFAHRLSSLPSDLKSSLVNALGEIIAHLDSFEIKLGDTRLTGKVRLGADAGMEAHFPGSEITPIEVRGTYRGSMHSEASLEGPRQHPALPAPGGAARRRRRMSTEEVKQDEGERSHCAVEDDGDLRYCRECRLEPCRWFGADLKRRREAVVGIARKNVSVVTADAGSREEDSGDVTYGHLYRLAQERRRKGLNGSPLSRLEHGLLCWVTLAVFSDDPERPEAPYEAREEALRQLERMGYVRRVGRKWGPTPSGFEASGLCGTRGLEMDP